MLTPYILPIAVTAVICVLAMALAWEAAPGRKRESLEIIRGDLRAEFRDNSKSPDLLSGLASLVHTRSAPDFNVYDPDDLKASAGLNFEHIISGHPDRHNAFAPRHGEYTLYELPGGRSVEWRRRAEDDPWRMESATRLTMTSPHYLDVDFRCVPTDAARFGPRNYAILFWCNYMNDVTDVPIHFLGVESHESEERWIAGDAPAGATDWNTGGTYRSILADDLAYDQDHNFKLNSWSYDYPRYTQPFYYGLTSHGMVYMLMFDRAHTPEDEIRFSIFKFKLKTHPRPAWDYQYVIRHIETGKQYGYRMRVAYKEFISPKDCLSEYRKWISSLDTDHTNRSRL